MGVGMGMDSGLTGAPEPLQAGLGGLWDAGLAGSSGGGVDISGPVSPLLGGTWSSIAGTARRRAQNMDEKHKAAENTASLPLECNSLRRLDVMYQSCAFWQCLRAYKN